MNPKQFFVIRNNQKYGPYTPEDINAYLESGDLTSADLAWHEDLEDRIPLLQVPGTLLHEWSRTRSASILEV